MNIDVQRVVATPAKDMACETSSGSVLQIQLWNTICFNSGFQLVVINREKKECARPVAINNAVDRGDRGDRGDEEEKEWCYRKEWH